MVKIFYAHSTNCDSNNATFENIFDIINKNNEIIWDVDKNKNLLLINAVTELINDSDLFICDITPDDLLNGKPLVNSNVMLELGYALQVIPEDRIIIILNEEICKVRPSIIEGIKYQPYYYDENNTDYCNDIVNIINNKVDEINKQYGKWKLVKYKLSNRFIYLINNLIGIKKSTYFIKMNPNNTNAFIIFENDKDTYMLNILNRTLKINDKTINLEDNKELFDELRHIELLANISWFN